MSAASRKSLASGTSESAAFRRSVGQTAPATWTANSTENIVPAARCSQRTRSMPPSRSTNDRAQGAGKNF
jgi:hypothetical protein